MHHRQGSLRCREPHLRTPALPFGGELTGQRHSDGHEQDRTQPVGFHRRGTRYPYSRQFSEVAWVTGCDFTSITDTGETPTPESWAIRARDTPARGFSAVPVDIDAANPHRDGPTEKVDPWRP